MRPVFEQEENLSIGKVSLLAHSDLECVNLEVKFTLTKLAGVEVHRNSFPSELAEQQLYAQEFIELYHSLEEPVVILPSTLIGELVFEALKVTYLLDYETAHEPVYPFFGVLFQSTLMSGKVEIE